jgi:prevent-host-death family protein
MAKVVNITEAKRQLSTLIDHAMKGDDVVFTRHGKPVVRLVPVASTKVRRLGFLRDQGWSPPLPLSLFDPEPEDAVEPQIGPYLAPIHSNPDQGNDLSA